MIEPDHGFLKPQENILLKVGYNPDVHVYFVVVVVVVVAVLELVVL